MKQPDLPPATAPTRPRLGSLDLLRGLVVMLMALDPSPWFESTLAYAYARAGDRAKAEQILRGLEDQAKQRYISPAPRMLFHLGLGEKDKGLDWLERCYEEQDGFCSGLKIYPGFDPLRPEPRFQALLKKVGLDQ